MRRLALLIRAAVLATALAGPLGAVEPDEMLDDPVLEARAREISKNLRCLVCQNQSIDDSNADLARDLRVLVRERLVAGDSDAEAVDFIVARYGDFVLLSPPMRPGTYALWFGPGLLLVVGGFFVARYFRRRRGQPPPPPLSGEERERLRELLGEDGTT